MDKAAHNESIRWINRLHIIYKIIVCTAVATILSRLIPISQNESGGNLFQIIWGWDIFCILLLLLYWHSFFTTSPIHIRKQAAKEDSSRVIIFSIILLSTFAGMLAVILLLTVHRQREGITSIHLPIAVIGMILSWLLVHTVFTVRYAHLYYSNRNNGADNHAGGLIFPGEEKPDFLDFAYFSFVLGMTFQVSDVTISSKRLRRWVLLHGLISFTYNTIIVALTINILAGLGD